jgi:hypothetical protein
MYNATRCIARARLCAFSVLSSFHLFIFSSFHLFIFSSFHLFIFSSFHLFIFSSFHLFIFSSVDGGLAVASCSGRDLAGQAEARRLLAASTRILGPYDGRPRLVYCVGG